MNSKMPTTKTSAASISPMETESVSRAVVDAVADAKGVSPLELEPPLYTAIDPDALERFVSSVGATQRTSAVDIRFSYAGFEVSVSGDGDVSLTVE